MLIKTEELLAQHQIEESRERQREKDLEYIMHNMRDSYYLDDASTDPTILDRQRGNAKTPEQVEALITALLPDAWFCVNPHNTGMKAAYMKPPPVDAKGCPLSTSRFLGAYPNHEVPEWSLFAKVYEDVPDPSYWGSNSKFINGADVDEAVKNGTLRPGWKRMRRPDEHLIKGWRSLMVVLVGRGLATPEAIERLVGAGDRLSWASHMGKTSKVSNW